MTARSDLRKRCNLCNKERSPTFFYKIDSAMFPDGLMSMCKDCINKTVDENNMQQVIDFLRRIDKPYLETYWIQAEKSKKKTLGEYIRKANSLPAFRGKTYEDSDGLQRLDLAKEKMLEKASDGIKTERGDKIVYDDKMIAYWGTGYTKHEYLLLEKFYYDMIDTHDNIITPIHKDMLKQLAKLSIKRNQLLELGDIGNYKKINDAFETTMKSANFRPADQKSTGEMSGLRSFSQAWEEVERRGFRKPPPIVLQEDVIDGMIIAQSNYYHKLVGQPILNSVPEEMKEELEDYLEDDEEALEDE